MKVLFVLNQILMRFDDSVHFWINFLQLLENQCIVLSFYIRILKSNDRECHNVESGGIEDGLIGMRSGKGDIDVVFSA